MAILKGYPPSNTVSPGQGPVQPFVIGIPDNKGQPKINITRGKKRVVAVIPARGNSKRIPNKNLKKIWGKPLLYWAIQSAKDCKEIDEVWVSTENLAISEATKNFGGLVLDRPEALVTDEASSESVLLHFAENVDFDILVFIQCTTPIINPKDLQEGIWAITNGKADSCLSVCTDKRFYWDENRKPLNYDLNNRPRSQEIKPWYKETGAFYISTRHALLDSKCRLSGKVDFVIVSEEASFEIDETMDFWLMEKMFPKRPIF